MRIRNPVLLGCCVAALAMLAAAPAADSAPQTSSGFTISSSPTVANGGLLESVAAVSATDVWAVGTANSRPLIENYNGTSWSVVPAAPHTGLGSTLTSVSAGGGAVWAVGSRLIDEEQSATLVERWTGSQWVRVHLPPKFVVRGALQSVYVFSDTDVWASGTIDTSHAVLHYDGSHWRQVTDVNLVGTDDDYTPGITAADPSHVFAVGDQDSADGSSGILERELRPNHWESDGSTTTEGGFLFGVSASSPTNVWAVGGEFNTTTGAEDPTAIHWDGTTATTVSSPGYTTNHSLDSVAAISPFDVWAVGDRETAANGHRTLIEHYTGGSAFADLGGPNVSGADNTLTSIAAVPGSSSDLWAVGAAGGQPLILHHT